MSRELMLSVTVSVDGFVAGANGETDWMVPGRSDEGRQWVAEQMWKAGLLAMGHQSYQDWADFWPTLAGVNSGPMNGVPKAVFSRSGEVSAPSMAKTTAALQAETSADTVALRKAIESWLHPVVAGKDLVADMQRLKAEDGKPILAIGGNSFATSLIEANLVDLYRLIVHPVVLGRGLSLFGALEAPLRLKQEDLKQFDSGVVVQTYRPC